MERWRGRRRQHQRKQQAVIQIRYRCNESIARSCHGATGLTSNNKGTTDVTDCTGEMGVGSSAVS